MDSVFTVRSKTREIRRMIAGMSMGVALALSSASALAVVYPDAVLKQLQETDAHFLNDNGFVSVAESDVHSVGADACVDSAPSDVHRSEGTQPRECSPVQRALMAVQQYEGELPHTRYRIAYRTEHALNNGYIEGLRAHIEVVRFNLGAMRHRDVSETVGDAHTAPVEHFGVGPHVAWRFVITPIQGVGAHIQDAVRKELTAAQAMESTCFGQPCLALDDIDMPEAQWQPMIDTLPADAAGPGPAPLHTIGRQMLAQVLHDGYGEPVEGLADGEPSIILVISDNVSGQDDMTSAVLHQSHVMDDAISDIWIKRVQYGGHVDWLQHIVYRPGRS